MIDPVITATVWEKYQTDRPQMGAELAVWVGKLSEESGIQAGTIRRVIASGAGAMMNAVTANIQTHAQQVADIIGADLVSALDVLREAMGATKKKILLDAQGRPKLGDEGELIWLETPDWQSRLSAVRTVVDVYGARAPQKFEVKQEITTVDLTPNAAIAELERLAVELPRLRAIYAAQQSGQGTTIDVGSGAKAEKQARSPRRALLADGMHPDKG